MIRLIVRRLIQLPLVLGAVYTIVLALAWAVPGSPLDRPEGKRPRAETIAAMKSQYNLDSFASFYFSYLDNATGFKYLRQTLNGEAAESERDAFARGETPPRRRVFDLGPSLFYRDQRVSEIIADSLPVSMTIGFAAMVIALVIGTTAGVISAARRGSFIDSATLVLSLAGISLPGFVIGTALLLVFGVWLPLFPVGEWGRPRSLVLPALTLSLPFAAYIARLTRMGMIEQMSMDYIRTARAKGLPERTVLLKHALKNAFLPVLSYLGPACAMAMTGSFVVERVFSVPGMGRHFVNAVQNKDLFLIIGVVMVFAAMLVVLNLAVDLMYRWVDPRIT